MLLCNLEQRLSVEVASGSETRLEGVLVRNQLSAALVVILLQAGGSKLDQYHEVMIVLPIVRRNEIRCMARVITHRIIHRNISDRR